MRSVSCRIRRGVERLSTAASAAFGTGPPIIPRVPNAPEHLIESSDETLLAAFAAGDASAFACLYARHERPLFRFLRRSLGNDAAAEDLLQEVWLAVVRHAGGFEPRARFTTWLYGIARNRLIDHWRARRGGVSLDAANDAVDGAPALIDTLAADPDGQPEVQALSRAQARAFMAAVEQLPPPQREAFLLHAEAGMTVEEVAQLTGVGHETAKSRLRYAMNRLRGALEPWR